MGPRDLRRLVWTKTLALNADFEEIFRELDGMGSKWILLVAGGLGAGKTTLVRNLVDARGAGRGEAASPTFALHHRYQVTIAGLTGPLDHWDLYRLQDEDDLETTGFWDLFAQQRGWIVIEWGDRLEPTILPFNWPLYELRIDGDGGLRQYQLYRWE